MFQTTDTLPASEEEKARYELHQNDDTDEGYVRWLTSFINSSVIPWYKQGSVLDFGSGPQAVLTDLLRDRDYPVYSYDPYFSDRWPEEGEPFSLILMCEVLEHVNDPAEVFRRLFSVSAEGAVISLKTAFLPSSGQVGDFKGWWYRQDITHIRFYNPQSLKVLGENSGWKLIRQDGKSLAVYEKSSPHKGAL
ncbi:MAG: class I SAM-dependent methyltransferase [Spirochaetales bacterium]|nr:class I SAM-dependent methyltransferase [Spirochaetales bacterium]